MSRAFSVSEHISSTPGALPPGSFMTPSATSARVTDESSLPPSLHDDNQLCHFMYAVCLVFSSIYYLCHLLARHFARNARARRYTTQNVTCNKVLYVAYSRASVCVCCKRETDFCFVILKSICKSSKVSQICSFISKRWRLVGKKNTFPPTLSSLVFYVQSSWLHGEPVPLWSERHRGGTDRERERERAMRPGR